MWSKFVTAGAAVIMMLQGVMVCLMERAEEAGLAEDKYARFRGSEAGKGDITTVDVIGAIITVAFGLALYLFERNKEGGSLIVRFREQQIGGSGGSLEPPRPLLEPPWASSYAPPYRLYGVF